jgi:rhamnulokinase
MKKYFLAIDFGASSGRHILGSINDGRLELEEIYRFENGMEEKNGHLCWNFQTLFHEVIEGLKKCSELGKIPSSIGIDTWGVDFVLLDEKDKLLGDNVAYRDSRTQGMDKKLFEKISERDLYKRTGIANQTFNTIYQLMAIKEQEPENLKKARAFLMTPAYFTFLLTGEKLNEYTLATTGQIINPKTRSWDYELLQSIGIPTEMFGRLVMPGTLVGDLLPEIQRQVGFNCKVVLPACHDTASAVAAVPASEDDFVYISSGTWSLMGTELMEPSLTEESRNMGFTNEGGYEGRYRYLKNIMGLWMIQCVKKELKSQGQDYSFGELCTMAEQEDSFPSRVDVDDSRFLAPKSMIKALKDYCAEDNQPIPEKPGQLAAVVYKSLAESYGRAIANIEKSTGKTYDCIYIVGGGCKAEYLNKLTAGATGKRISSGPSEATAMGNLMVQMISLGEISSLKEARQISARTL